MTEHDDEVRLPDTLFPHKMRRNEPCWCGSGRKWKLCHKDRSSEASPNYFEFAGRHRREFERGSCLHPDAPGKCDGKVIKSHTLQRSRALGLLSENGHVYWAKSAVHRIHQNGGELVPQRVGVREATTFLGFCAKHDALTFAPIEADKVKLNREAAMLLMYRAVCLELFQKRAAVAVTKNLFAADAGGNLWDQFQIQNFLRAMLYGMELGLADLEALKSKMDALLNALDFTAINMSVIEFNDLLPVMAACAFQPEWDFQGNKLQSLGQRHLQQVALTVTRMGDRNLAAICWLGDHQDKSKAFADSLFALPNDDISTAVTRACFVHTENVVIRPSFWENVSDNQRGELLRLIALGMPRDEGVRSPKDLTLADTEIKINDGVLGKYSFRCTDNLWQ